ncbi:MAG: small-conductance mechanosensitive channel [Myxococcota bacterium]|jgi:small-conductance mechanosensitive channel
MDWLLDAVVSPEIVGRWLRAALLVLLGFLLARLAGSVTERMVHRFSQPERAILSRRVVSLVVLVLCLLSAMQQVGFDLSILLGAAGMFTVAIGFASQTSSSNIISGLFLIAERPFSVGDAIQLGAQSGEVLAIDLLSVKLRTFDNRYVRIPNETVMKSEVTNLTRFTIRRLSVPLIVPHRTDLDAVRQVLLAVADVDALVLDEPKAEVRFSGFIPDGAQIELVVWVERVRLLEVQGGLGWRVHQALAKSGLDLTPSYRKMPEPTSVG